MRHTTHGTTIQHDENYYSFRKGKTTRLTPGAMNFAFLPKFNLPSLLFRGASRLAGALSVFQSPQVESPQILLISGFGGIPNNQFTTFYNLNNPKLIPDINNPNTFVNPEHGETYPSSSQANYGVAAIELS